MAIGTLAAHERLQPQSLTRTIVELEERGYVLRERDGMDRRRARVSITAMGEQRLRETVQRRDAWFTSVIEHELSDLEGDLLRIAASLLERIADAAEVAVSDEREGIA